jgi:hypothetical protein
MESNTEMTLPDPPKRPRGQPRKPKTAVKSVRLPLDLWEALEGLPGSTIADKLRPTLHAAASKPRKPRFVLFSDGTWQNANDTSIIILHDQ